MPHSGHTTRVPTNSKHNVNDLLSTFNWHARLPSLNSSPLIHDSDHRSALKNTDLCIVIKSHQRETTRSPNSVQVNISTNIRIVVPPQASPRNQRHTTNNHFSPEPGSPSESNLATSSGSATFMRTIERSLRDDGGPASALERSAKKSLTTIPF